MARILYAVNGEGMGHAIRSKVVIGHLISQNHKVVIAAGDRAFDFLSKHFPNVYDIECYRIVYENNRAMNVKTAIAYFRKLPKTLAKNFSQFMKMLVKFEPEIVITDFEPFSNFISRIFGIPVIAIDNNSIMSKGNIEVPKDEMGSYFIAVGVTHSFCKLKADKYIINTFFYPPIDSEDTVLVPPALRPEVLGTKPSKGKHILVYQTSATNDSLINAMKSIKENFVVYGFNADKREKNLLFKKFDEGRFIKDLASCKAAIVNGGFTVLSEAIYLHKPILSVPVRNQFEQILNAVYLQKHGYGEYHKIASADAIKNFISNLPKYEKSLKNYKQDGNGVLYRETDKAIAEIIKNNKNYIPRLKQNIRLINDWVSAFFGMQGLKKNA